jgi:NADH-quinone oxidoreductase subunit L
VLDVLWLIPALPLAGFILILLFGRRLGEPVAGWLATAMVAASFAVSVAVYIEMLGLDAEERSHVDVVFSWIPVGALQVDMAFLADPLSIVMCLFITGIGALIHLYSIGYMHGDPKFSKFFLYLNLFVFSMLLLVLGENMLVTFLGWEGVGTCSYFLIAFWHTRESAATAGKKAFVTNRVGDWGFMMAMFLAFSTVGSLSFGVLNNNAESGLLAQTTATGIAVMLFVGAVGKSAQLPLYIWLPDAMAGPTPVSALIHAATMVTAGVYLMVRVNPVLAVSADWVGPTIAWVGVITAFFAATIALAQTDIKRVLAYSTVSQLGFMFLAIGTGAYVAAVFHMVTHAIFKALLFLGSGSVIHGMHDEQDMRKMGKLAKFMPITCGTFIIGWLAIAGVPPFAGFWSKDEIMLFAAADSTLLYVVVYATALLTAIYMTRQVIMTFFGKAHWGADAEVVTTMNTDGEVVHAGADEHVAHAHDDHGAHAGFEPHESPPIMLIPLVVLGILAVLAGIMQLPSLGIIPDEYEHRLEAWLHPVVQYGEADIHETWAYDHLVLLLFAAIACALAGIAIAWLIYQKRKVKAFEPKLFAEGWYYDKAVTWFMGTPGRRGFEGAALFDAKVVDGAVTGTAVVVRETANEVRKGETGYVRQYGAVIGIGVVLLLGWFVIVQGII